MQARLLSPHDGLAACIPVAKDEEQRGTAKHSAKAHHKCRVKIMSRQDHGDLRRGRECHRSLRAELRFIFAGTGVSLARNFARLPACLGWRGARGCTSSRHPRSGSSVAEARRHREREGSTLLPARTNLCISPSSQFEFHLLRSSHFTWTPAQHQGPRMRLANLYIFSHAF